MFDRKFLKLLFAFFPIILTNASFRHHGDFCDWQSPMETCDRTKGLSCSYKSHTCTCWDVRTIYSAEKGRCVGKSGEECHFFGGERLCVENAFCLEDDSVSHIPTCLCLKGYFRGSDGSCVRRSKYGGFCQLSNKFLPTGSNTRDSNDNTAMSNSNSNCESNFQCINYTCKCEAHQIYVENLESCISLAGGQCSKSLNNCVENAECAEKIWALDQLSGETKVVGHRCACKPGLKVTEDGFCAVEYGGDCTSNSECYFGLTCINSKCQCHPLSQVYDKRIKKCLNLVGTKCQNQHVKQDRVAPASYQHEGIDFILDQHQQPLLSQATQPEPTTTSTTTPSTTTKNTPISSSTTTTTKLPKSTTKLSPTTKTPSVLTKSRNLSSRNFDFAHRTWHFISPRLHTENHPRNFYPPYPEHRNSLEVPVISQCVRNAECVLSPSDPEQSSYCKCTNGSTTTIMRTCLLDYGALCSGNPLDCNFYKGLLCQSDSGTCNCADPMLIYDTEKKTCVSKVGNPCGRMKLNGMLLFNSFNNQPKDKEMSKDYSNVPPFYPYQTDQFVNINCISGATCVDASFSGQPMQICASRGKLSANNFAYAS